MESAILLKTGIQNPGLTNNDWNPVPGNPESTVWNPESKKIPSTFLAGRMEGGGGGGMGSRRRCFKHSLEYKYFSRLVKIIIRILQLFLFFFFY